MKPEFLSDIAFSITPVGSRVTCDPPPTDTDEDWLVHSYNVQKAIDLLSQNGFTLDNPNLHYAPDTGAFNSWRKGNVNVILTKDYDFNRRFLAASAMAKRFNLLEKPDRVALFQAVLYGNGGPEAPLPDFLNPTHNEENLR
jgi:hypothetical protein